MTDRQRRILTTTSQHAHGRQGWCVIHRSDADRALSRINRGTLGDFDIPDLPVESFTIRMMGRSQANRLVGRIQGRRTRHRFDENSVGLNA